MERRMMMPGGWLGMGLVIGLVMSGCANKDARVAPTFSQEETELGPRNQYGASFSTGGRFAEQLEKASRLAGSGEYVKAQHLYASVYEERSAEDEERAAALFGLSQVSSDILNPKKDFDVARSYLRTLLIEFPESSLRESAEARLASLETLQKTGLGVEVAGRPRGSARPRRATCSGAPRPPRGARTRLRVSLPRGLLR